MPIESDVQRPDPGDRIELFDLDCRSLGGDVYRFTKSIFASQPVVWRGYTYTPMNVEITGFEINGKGTLPRPLMRISNTTMALSAAVLEWNELLGAVITRWRTFKKYLDQGTNPDPDACFPPDIYIVRRRTKQNRKLIEWELGAFMDFEGKKLPRRQILRDTCTLTYRVYKSDTDSFDYTDVDCPYVAATYYDDLGQATTKNADKCGRGLNDCKIRFPGKQPLPAFLFPGVARVRVNQ
jgi:lambda family phage minor tail protein L